MKLSSVIQKKYEQYILHLVDVKLPAKRIHKYNNQYVLNQFKKMLNEVNQWKTLSYFKDSPNVKFHYKYLQQLFNKWSSLNIFEDAYELLLTNDYFKLKDIRKSKKLFLFIDATFIINKYGIECVTKNPEYKKKRVTKLSLICDENKTILSVINDETHSNVIKKCVTFSHDVKLVQPTLDNMKITVPKYVSIKLGGDKGYITQKQFKINETTVKVIAPKRKNQKTKNTKKEKIILNKRHCVENSICSFKKYERLLVRKDKLIKNYMSFLYLGLCEKLCCANKLYTNNELI